MKRPILLATLVLCAWCVAAGAAPVILADLPIRFTRAWGIDPELRRAFVIDDEFDHVSVIDLDTGRLLGSYDAGTSPTGLVVDAALHLVYWANHTGPGYITVFDARTSKMDLILGVGNEPHVVAADFARHRVFTINDGDDSISVIDTTTNRVVRKVLIGAPPRGLDIDRLRGRLYVVAPPHTLWTMDENGDAATPMIIGRDPFPPRVDERTGKVYVLSGSDQSLSVLEDSGLVKTISLPAVPSEAAPAISPVYHRLYFTSPANDTLTIVDADTAAIVRTVGVRPGPVDVTIDEGDGNIYVAHITDKSVSILDARTEAVIGNLPVGDHALHLATGVDRLLVMTNSSVKIATQQNTLGATKVATEWHHAGFDHYFHSADEVENRVIEDGRFGSDWVRTMQFFRIWTEAIPGRPGVCRFFSASFAPQSSHFYTPYPAECELRKLDPAWQFETATAYVLALTDASGGCGASTPLYRLYNDGQGGAPNHRYTANRGTRDRMRDAGWLSEGNGPDEIFACTPTLRGD